jgi:replicative DNA helicase
VTNSLKNSGTLEMVGGLAYVAELVDYTPTSANVAHYCQIVKEKSVLRQLHDFGGSLITAATTDKELPRILSDAREKLVAITGSMVGLNGVSQGHIFTLEQRERQYEASVSTIDTTRFKTGFKLLDQQIRGVAPGELLIIIAYSGTFKTAFLQNILLRSAETTGCHHLFFSLEMPVEKVFEREMQIQGGVSGRDVENHFRGQKYSEGVINGMGRGGSDRLLVCDRPRLTLEQIGRYVELARQKHGRIAAIGIDYLGLIQAPGKTLFEKTAYVSIEAKNLAKELRVPVIMLCQINRAAATGGEIETHSAKGGGDVEAAADFMLGFQLEGHDVTCKILKNRNGAVNAKFLADIDRTALCFKELKPYTPERGKKQREELPY